jgi:signal transduction histidine kinase
VFFVAAALFLALWLIERHAHVRLREQRGETEWVRLDRDLALAEQTGRLRIIRELQDVAIQSVSRLISDADGARYAGERDPQVAVRAAGALADHGRSALGELRGVLTIVNAGEKVNAARPSLAEAQELVRVMRDAGLDVRFEERGEPFSLMPGAELSVLRILQRSLENALHHGGEGTTVRVAYDWGVDGLRLTVDDDGIRASARRKGLAPDEVDRATRYGVEEDLRALTVAPDGATLTEMRERAELYGGLLAAKQVPGIGFSVSALFPALRFRNGVHLRS